MGTVTFLFTDIVGSTRLWETRPDMDSLVAAHLAALREAVTRHGGMVFTEMGDGIAAAFTFAGDAVRAAVDAQIAGAGGVLTARMGIHTGEAEPRNGDYFGPPVNRAARVMAVAHGGQVVLTQRTADELVEVPIEGVDLLDLGKHRLRDLSEPEHLWQVLHESLPFEFPQLRSLDAYTGNLPPQRTTYIGRKDALERIDTFLGSRRLITLTGVGGAGKTRLALQAAAHALPRFPGGAWLVELASTSDPGAVPSIARSSLHAAAMPGMTDTESVCVHLGSTRTLLILDNCEHVLEAAGDLATTVLDRCPNVVVLATSREGLDLEGEQILALRSLAAGNEGTALFLDRALSVDPDLKVDVAMLDAVIDICERLDGLPLAIELAAARVATTSVNDIRAGLDDRFRVLAGGRRRAVERHQTMRAAIDWSHHLLDHHEQVVLRRLAVFAGGFTIDAAVTVCGDRLCLDPLEAGTVRDAIDSLVRKSMVQFDRERDRYRLLETVRAYANERLAEAGEDVTVRRAHAEWMAGLVEHPLEEWYGERGFDLAAVALAEIDNWRDAAHFAIDTSDQDLAPRLFGAPLVGDNPEMARWAEAALAAIDGPYPGQQRLHWTIAMTHGSMLQVDECEAHLDRFEALATDDEERSWALMLRSLNAEARDRSGRELLQRELVNDGLAPNLRTYLLTLQALYSNLPPHNDVALARRAVAESERLRHYMTPIAYVTLAMACAPHDVDEAVLALTRAQMSAEEHPSVFMKTSVAGWGSMTVVGLPPETAAAHLLAQTSRMQRHWTNAHVGFLTTCATVLHSIQPEVAERIAAFVLRKSGATATTLRDLCPDIDVASLAPSQDDLDTIMALTRTALTALTAVTWDDAPA